MKKLALYAALGSVVLMTGCASILNDKTQPVNVSSSNGKQITGSIDGIPFQAPGVVNFYRDKKAKIVTTDTPGCTKQTVAESNVDLKFFINVLIPFGTFGSTSDYASDKMWKYSDNVVVSCQ